MKTAFDQNLCLAWLKKGRLRPAMEYLAQFPEQAELYQQYMSLYQQEHYLSYDVDSQLQDILLAYQKYYRDAFYLEQSPEEAAEGLRARLAGLLGDGAASLDELEELAAEAFRTGEFHFLGGRTGGWSNGDGLIHCVKRHYDLKSESFRVSLLKHEAQHASDQSRYPGMSSVDLEYRAKLVELIYSEERQLLGRFLQEADAANPGSAHGLAAERIVRGFARRQDGDGLAALPIETVRAAALELFRESSREMAEKYR